jgi:hypothetical protein
MAPTALSLGMSIPSFWKGLRDEIWRSRAMEAAALAEPILCHIPPKLINRNLNMSNTSEGRVVWSLTLVRNVKRENFFRSTYAGITKKASAPSTDYAKPRARPKSSGGKLQIVLSHVHHLPRRAIMWSLLGHIIQPAETKLHSYSHRQEQKLLLGKIRTTLLCGLHPRALRVAGKGRETHKNGVRIKPDLSVKIGPTISAWSSHSTSVK